MALKNPYKRGDMYEVYTIIRLTKNQVFELLELEVKKTSDKILFINNSKTPKSGV